MLSQEIKHVAIFTVFLLHHVVIYAMPHSETDGPSIPEDKSQLDGWFQATLNPCTSRQTSLESELAAAEAGARVIKVRLDENGEYKTVTDAFISIPSGNTKRFILWIGLGEYREKIKIDRSKQFVTLYGSPNAIPTLTFDGTAAKCDTVDSANLVVATECIYLV